MRKKVDILRSLLEVKFLWTIIWINTLEQSFGTFQYLDAPSFTFFLLSNQLPAMQSL